MSIFTISLARGTIDSPDFYDDFIKSSNDDCTNDDCLKRKYEPISDWNKSLPPYDLSNIIPYLASQETKRNDGTQMGIFTGCGCHSTVRVHKKTIAIIKNYLKNYLSI